MTYERRNKGTCSVMTKVELNPDHTIESVEVLGGCNGNLKGICQLLKGMKAEDAIERMKGTLCGSKPTSCPDQIAQNLKKALEEMRESDNFKGDSATKRTIFQKFRNYFS